jgi:hypothetical protein
MIIREFYYDEDTRRLYIEFSTEEDGDDFYRILDLEYWDIKYYSSEIIEELDLNDIDELFIIDLISNYLKDNDLPKEHVL